MGLVEIKKEIRHKANQPRAQFLQRFFKTGRGGYAEGDKFLGLRVPEQRVIAKKFLDLELPEVLQLLKSPYHEERLIALLILGGKFPKEDKKGQKAIFDFYIRNAKLVNNWDLVDSSAYKIAGEYLLDKNWAILKKLSQSKNLWERRIAIVATYQFIRNRKFQPTLEISKRLLGDKHDLIHKAVGWMLREMGKKDEKVLRQFLSQNVAQMPRTALRYSIERFSAKERQKILTYGIINRL